jgi:hypothetical protein
VRWLPLLLAAGCIENSLRAEETDVADTEAQDTDVPGPDTATPDTDAEDSDEPVETDVPEDTDSPEDTDTDVPEDTDEPVDTGTSTPDGPIALAGTCPSYPYTAWGDPSAAAPELHVVGMYESAFGSPGRADVSVVRTSEVVLALTSYSAVDWVVDLDAASFVTGIVVSDYGGVSTASFASSTTAPVTYTRLGECAYEIPDMDPTSGCETPDLQVAVEAFTGLPMASFQGCYAGGTFEID